MNQAGTVDRAEIERFSRQAALWWDPDGPFRSLHRLNPVRLGYIRDRAIRHFDGDPGSVTPLAGLRLLDLGCGGGLVAEPLAQLGAEVTAIDADEAAIDAARVHAAQRRIPVDYGVGAAEDMVAAGRRFDAVLALEIVEHVADPEVFFGTLGALVRPGGLVILSTLNRTLKSLVLGIGVAEYALRWVAPGTHDWRKFVRPSELARLLRAAGFDLADLTGLVFDPLAGAFRLKPGAVAVNYFATAAKGRIVSI
jgi:2-polyprenyl-6-hydroxyphenyl methylase/3-demethylubiquinone-9 3-methyltransferase